MATGTDDRIFYGTKAQERLKLFASPAEFLAPKHNRTMVEIEEDEHSER